MQKANRRLIEIVNLIKMNYRRNKITLNLHLSLHLYDCSFDYGLLYAFWYFSFECMNGILDFLLNSNRKIELCRLMFSNQVKSIINSSEVKMKGLELLGKWPSIGSLLVT